ncbi:phosphatidylinositol glycan anchor biosynthesis class U protein-like [Elysia marginata]|uniref:Phosphatidylinositol glycan anchor biosynthesis class U protein-like n=1 Tax=Elysia marginata TaxID=1093978 RepID=A0AAV4JWK3_9GAST|nr:phosphatidylinositol glycan anchor biosynthesis class U protein-like [Elysia marginata]
MASAGVYLVGFLGVLIRVVLMNTNLPKWLRSRNEVITPITSWEKVEEGFSLQRQLISPYTGDLFHETPLALRSLKIAHYFPYRVSGFFMIIDILTMVFLFKIAASFVKYLLCTQEKEKDNYSSKAKPLILTEYYLSWLPLTVVGVHALSPFSIMTTLASSTAAVTNLAVLIAFYNMVIGNRVLCTLFLAIASYQTLYPMVFIVPAALHFCKQSKKLASVSYTSRESIYSYVETLSLFGTFLGLLVGFSFLVEGNWNFVFSTYGFILNVPDLTPNIGVFWYFFTEMFDHFRTLFVCVFQLNAVVYTLPLAIKFSEKPFFLLYVLIFLTSIFKSYPSYGDAALYFSLLPLWSHVFPYMRNTLVVCGMYICSVVLAPILYHLWIFAGSANANFYFAITLVYSTAQIFLVTDVIFAYLRREYDLYHGTEHLNPDGTKARIRLD